MVGIVILMSIIIVLETWLMFAYKNDVDRLSHNVGLILKEMSDRQSRWENL
jgi:hypothetical protein